MATSAKYISSVLVMWWTGILESNLKHEWRLIQELMKLIILKIKEDKKKSLEAYNLLENKCNKQTKATITQYRDTLW